MQGHLPDSGSHQPSTGALSSSETPKDMAPMKSLREVRSQSHTSTLSRRSTSPGFRLLQEGGGQNEVPSSRLPHSPSLVLKEEANPASWSLFPAVWSIFPSPVLMLGGSLPPSGALSKPRQLSLHLPPSLMHS